MGTLVAGLHGLHRLPGDGAVHGLLAALGQLFAFLAALCAWLCWLCSSASSVISSLGVLDGVRAALLSLSSTPFASIAAACCSCCSALLGSLSSWASSVGTLPLLGAVYGCFSRLVASLAVSVRCFAVLDAVRALVGRVVARIHAFLGQAARSAVWLCVALVALLRALGSVSGMVAALRSWSGVLGSCWLGLRDAVRALPRPGCFFGSTASLFTGSLWSLGRFLAGLRVLSAAFDSASDSALGVMAGMAKQCRLM